MSVEENKKDYEQIVIKNGFPGDSIVYEAYYEDIKTLFDYITNLQEEKERLKNGIKELDDMFYETFRISQNGYYSISEWELKDFTDKLKELKEDNKC